MKAVHTPKSLPWLARRARVSDQVADRLWNDALAMAGPDSPETAEPRRQAKAMQYLLLMLGLGTATCGFTAGTSALAYEAVCQ